MAASMILTTVPAGAADPPAAVIAAIEAAVTSHPSWTAIDDVTFTRGGVARTGRVLQNAGGAASYSGRKMTLILARATTYNAAATGTSNVFVYGSEEWNPATKQPRGHVSMQNGLATPNAADTTALGLGVDADLAQNAASTASALNEVGGNFVINASSPIEVAVYVDKSAVMASWLQGTNAGSVIFTQMIEPDTVPAAWRGAALLQPGSISPGSANGQLTRAGYSVMVTSPWQATLTGAAFAEGLVAAGAGASIPDRITGRYAGTPLIVRSSASTGAPTVATSTGTFSFREFTHGALPSKFIAFNEYGTLAGNAKGGDAITLGGKTYTRLVTSSGVGVWADMTGPDF